MSEPGLNYKVTVSGASQGAAEVEKLASASGKVADSAGKAAPQAKSLGEAIASLGGRNNAAKDVLEGVSTAAQGGSGAVFGLTKAFRAFRELLNGGFAALGPGGILVGGLGVLVGLLPKVWDLMNTGKKSAADLAEEARAAAETMKILGAARLEGLKTAFDAVQASAKKANEEFSEMLAYQERLDNAQKTVDLAKIRNDESLTAEQKAAKIAETESFYSDKGLALTLSKKQFEAAQAGNAVKAADSNLEDARNAEVEARRKLVPLLEQQAAYEANKKRYDNAIDNQDALYWLRQMRRTPAADPVALAEATADVEARKKETDKAYALAQQARDEKQKADRAAKFEKDAQLAESEARSKVQSFDQGAAAKARLQQATKKQAAADNREDYLEATREKISAQGELEQSRRRTGAGTAGSIDASPLKAAADSISTGMEKSLSESNQAIREGASAIQKVMTESVQPPNFDPLMQAVTAGFAEVKTAMGEVQNKIRLHSYAIEQIRSQIAHMRTVMSGS